MLTPTNKPLGQPAGHWGVRRRKQAMVQTLLGRLLFMAASLAPMRWGLTAREEERCRR